LRFGSFLNRLERNLGGEAGLRVPLLTPKAGNDSGFYVSVRFLGAAAVPTKSSRVILHQKIAFD
jgi:hypothetical protein